MRLRRLTFRNHLGVRWARRLGAITSAAIVATSMLLAVGTNGLPAGASTPKRTPIAVGDICSCTGPLAAGDLQTTATAQAWVAWVNAHGGLKGHPVKLFYYNDQTNPGLATTDVEKLINVNHVAAIFDNSAVDLVFMPNATSAGVPVIGGINTIDYMGTDYFTSGTTDNYGVTGQVYGAAKLGNGIKDLAILYCVEAAGCQTTEKAAVPVGARVGINLVYNLGIAYGAPNYTAPCLAAEQSGAKALAVFDGEAIVQKVIDDCGTQGYHPIPIETTGEIADSFVSDPNFTKLIAEMNNIPWFVHNATTKDFYAALDKYAPTLPSDPNFGETAISQWANGVLLQDAITAAAPSQGSTVTAAVVKKGLYHLPAGDNLGGLSPQALHYTKGVPNNFSCWFYVGVKDGKFIWTNGHKPICPPLMAPGTVEGGPLLKVQPKVTTS